MTCVITHEHRPTPEARRTEASSSSLHSAAAAADPAMTPSSSDALTRVAGRSTSSTESIPSERPAHATRSGSAASAASTATATSSSSSHPFARSAALSPFPSLGPVLPFASLSASSFPPPPLLSSGVGLSSSHLGLIALDPCRSILRPPVLRRLKRDFILHGCGRPSEEKIQRMKEREKKRSARDRAEEEEERRKKKKKRDKTVSGAQVSTVSIC